MSLRKHQGETGGGMMNDNDRKRLTEWLGECWHEEDANATAQQIRDQHDRAIWAICANCGEPFLKQQGHTFATPSDMMACKDRLVELGIIEHFDAFIYIKWHEWFEGDEGQFIYFWEWLMEPARFCQLVADFLNERK